MTSEQLDLETVDETPPISDYECKRSKIEGKKLWKYGYRVSFILVGEFKSDDRAHTERIEEANLAKAAPSNVYKLGCW